MTKQLLEQFELLVGTVTTLRSDNGCPWDRKQTNESLKKYLKEEFSEIITALESKDHDNLCEELGDFLYLIIMLAEINSQNNLFTLEDVVRRIDRKLIRRHPHVFGTATIADEAALKQQWQDIKAAEKKDKKT